MRTDAETIAFLNDCLNKLDNVVECERRDKAAWRAALEKIVGEQNAWIKFQEALASV
jgi:hypothetical protein